MGYFDKDTTDEVVETVEEIVEVTETPEEKAPEVKEVKEKKAKKETKKESKVSAKTDEELVREYAMGKEYNLKNPQTYNAILKIVKGKK